MKDYLQQLGELETFDEVLEWSRGVWGPELRPNMRSSENLTEQLIQSATERIPDRSDERWLACIFLRLPSEDTSYGGFQRIRVAKATFSWPDRILVSVFEE